MAAIDEQVFCNWCGQLRGFSDEVCPSEHNSLDRHEWVLSERDVRAAIAAALDEIDAIAESVELIPFAGEDDWRGGMRAAARGARRALLGEVPTEHPAAPSGEQ